MPQPAPQASPRMPAMVNRVVQFLRFLAHRFDTDRGMESAAALTYTTLLSLVPLMAVTFSAMTAFPIFESLSDEINSFVFDNFVPASGDVLNQHLKDFTANAKRLTGAGLVFLIVVAVLMMATIDRAFAQIFRVHQRRSALSAFLVYWAILTLGPLLIGLSLAVTSYLVSLPVLSQATHTLEGTFKLLSVAPVLISTMGFSLTYWLVPNRPVRFRRALLGGVVAALLFEAAKHIFAWYVTTFPTYEAIYGALAAVPVFLVWIYLSWVITLLGAELTAALADFEHVRDDGELDDSLPALTVAEHILSVLWRAQNAATPLTGEELADRLPSTSVDRVRDLLDRLADAGLLRRDDQEQWFIARDLQQLTMFDLYRIVGEALPAGRSGGLAAAEQALQAALAQTLHERLGADQGLAPVANLAKAASKSSSGSDEA